MTVGFGRSDLVVMYICISIIMEQSKPYHNIKPKSEQPNRKEKKGKQQKIKTKTTMK